MWVAHHSLAVGLPSGSLAAAAWAEGPGPRGGEAAPPRVAVLSEGTRLGSAVGRVWSSIRGRQANTAVLAAAALPPHPLQYAPPPFLLQFLRRARCPPPVHRRSP